MRLSLLSFLSAAVAAGISVSSFAAGWEVDTSAKTLTYKDANDAVVWQFSCTFSGTDSKDIKLTSRVTSPSVATDLDLYGLPDDYAVVNLGNVFQGFYKVSSVREPNRLTTLQDYAFYSYDGNDTSLTNFSGGAAITSCGRDVFRWRKGMTGDLAFPNLTSIPQGLFSDCGKLKSFSAPLATQIGADAFSGCSGMTNLVLNWSEMAAIEGGGLANCTGFKGDYKMPKLTRFGGARGTPVTSIDAPNVTWIGTYAFFQITSLTNITFGPKVTSIQNADGRTFEGCSKLQGDMKFDLLPSVPPSFFNGCGKITSASFTNATSVGDGAFANCSSLTNFYFTPSLLKKIGANALSKTALKGRWDFPEVTEFGGFKWVYGVTALYAPKAEIINANTCYGASGLTTLVLGSGVTSITGEENLTNCGNLTGDFDFSKVVSIPRNFMFGTKIGSVRLDSATTFGSSAFGNVPLTNIVLGAATALPASLFNGAKAGCCVDFLGGVPTFGSLTFPARATCYRFYVRSRENLAAWTSACFALRGTDGFEPYKVGAPKRTIGVMYANSEHSAIAYVIDGTPTGFVLLFR